MLLKNAITSLQLGIEDYESSDPRRNISAIRNIYAGILLLYKEKLNRISPDGLFLKKRIKLNFKQDGTIDPVAYGDSTVTVQEIQERFKSLSIDNDWERFDKIRKIRNEIEHYYTKNSDAHLKETLSNSFLLIRDFVKKHLKESPVELLSSRYWNLLLKTHEVYEAERSDCLKSFENFDHVYEAVNNVLRAMRCPQCQCELIKLISGEKLFSPDIQFRCSSCSTLFSFFEICENTLNEIFYTDNYLAATQGGEPATKTCPECGKHTYVVNDDVCLTCEATRSFNYCGCCGAYLELYEQELDGLCTGCYHRAWKDD